MEDGDRANNVVVHHHHGGLTLGLPASNLPAALAATAGGGGGSREDCWSEGATNTLIDSWGERYLNLNRGNLKQKHWREVSDAVNARSGGHKLRKTDVQCKNRLDTLKKKYKLEKAKICNGILIGPSKWPFYAKLDNLIGPSKTKHHQALKHFRLHPQPQPQPLPPPLPPPLPSKRPDGGFNSLSSGSVDATESLPSDGVDEKHKRGRRSSSSSQSPVRELAQAIMKFGEIYERIEGTKQQQMMELEKHRMEFTRDLEVQRMQLFMQTQIEVAKMEHAKHGGTGVGEVLFDRESSLALHGILRSNFKNLKLRVLLRYLKPAISNYVKKLLIQSDLKLMIQECKRQVDNLTMEFNF